MGAQFYMVGSNVFPVENKPYTRTVLLIMKTGMRTNQHRWRICGQDACDSQLPWSVQAERRWYSLQLVQWAEDLHKPRPRSIHVLDGYGVLGEEVELMYISG
jgi:hypothetical protein